VGDTVIDNLHYLKMYVQTEIQPFEFDLSRASLSSFIRNDTVNKRVYQKGLWDTTEYVLYDFSLQIGDTVQLSNGHDFSADFYAVRVDSIEIETGKYNYPDFFKASDIDSIITLADGTSRRRILVKVLYKWKGSTAYNYSDKMSPQVWVESIGSSNGLYFEISETFWTADAGWERLLCYAKNNTVLLSYPFDIDFISDCWGWPWGVGIANPAIFEKIKLYPNPAHNQITIQLDNLDMQKSTLLYLYNLQGQCLLTKFVTEPIFTLDISQYKEGIYFVEIKQKNGQKYYSKIIKN
jgi:hypothetical protein